jgi:hypothetical protein
MSEVYLTDFLLILACGYLFISVVGIATGYGLDDLGVGVPVPAGWKNFLFSTSSRPVMGLTQPPIQ